MATDLSQTPLSVPQGATLIQKIYFTNPLQDYTLAATVSQGLITLTGDPAPGLVITVNVNGHTFTLRPADDQQTSQIATALVSLLQYTDGNSAHNSTNFSSVAGSAPNSVLCLALDSTVLPITVSISQTPTANFGNCTAEMMVRQSYASAPLLTLTSSAGLTLDPVAGSILIEMTSDQTAALPVNYTPPSALSGFIATGIADPTAQFAFDIKITYQSGFTRVFTGGVLTVTGVVTR